MATEDSIEKQVIEKVHPSLKAEIERCIEECGKIEGQRWCRDNGSCVFGRVGESGKYEGIGMIFYSLPDSEGCVYFGNLKNGELHGNGTFFLTDGHKYCGEFAKNNQHGPGIFYYHEQEVQEEFYRDGVLVKAKIISGFDLEFILNLVHQSVKERLKKEIEKMMKNPDFTVMREFDSYIFQASSITNDFGLMVQRDGSVFKGWFALYKESGTGEKTTSIGEKEAGHWVIGNRHGEFQLSDHKEEKIYAVYDDNSSVLVLR